MSTTISSNTFDWYKFLGQWSQELISNSKYAIHLPKAVKESGWLGFPGASEEQINQLEDRLQISLPPSYREFLKVSNGWRQTTPFIYRIWSVDEVDWFSQRHLDWIQSFSEKHLRNYHEKSLENKNQNGSLQGLNISDSEYFLYGEAQDCSKIRLRYLSSSLEISEKGESAIYLLNPEVIASNGEWEAWFFGDWLPGADRYVSFQEMMEAEYKNFIEMKEVT
jgi:hypothetical protein